MENRNTQAATPFSFDDSDIAKWTLPEGAMARLGRGSVRDMAFSPDGQHFAVGTNIGIWLYEPSTLSPIALRETDRGYIDDVTFSPDSRWIALHRYHEAIRVWDIQNEVCIAEMELTKVQDRWGLSKPIFSQDGERLVVFNGREYNRKVQTWSPQTGALLSETEISSTTYGVYPTCFSPDLSLLAGTCYIRDSRTAEFIAMWDVETGEQVARLDWSEERWGRLCLSPCGQFLAAGGSEGRIQVWNVESGDLEEIYTKHEDAQMHPYYPPEGGLIAAAASPSQSKIDIWYLEKGEKIDTFGHQSEGKFVRFSENGTQLAYTDSGEIKIWTKGRPTDQASPTIQGPTKPVTVGSLVLTPDKKTIVATYWGRKAFLWDVSNQRVRHPTEEELPDKTYKVYLSANGKIFATSRDEDRLKVRTFGSNEPIAAIPFPESELISTEVLAPTGHRFAAVDRDRNIHVWKRPSPSNSEDRRGNWEKCAVLIGHPKGIGTLAFSPDGKRLASISIDRTALLWDVDTGEQIAEMDLPAPVGKRIGPHTAVGVAFSPLGDIIAGGHRGDIMLWDATDGKTVMTIPQSEESQRAIALCFSPCGEYLASGAWWQGGLQKVPIRLWKVATGENIATFWGHTTDVQCFTFSQDGTLLVSGGYDGVIYLWDLKSYL
ncbi:MAG: WD40 repeat domain-containing protein [Candidatus Poribacteria bacterium]|nr:WD40 repeat domain-containing protein [Candidatus Poribacteria bacterium]